MIEMRNDDIVMVGDETNVRFILEKRGENQLIVIGANPSTATNEKNDNTMGCVAWIAKKNGFDGFVMLNLNAQRSTNPDELPQEMDVDLHQANVKHISELLKWKSSPVILLAFGDIIEKRKYLKQCFADIVAAILPNNPHWLQLGELTRKGNPRHPLRHANDPLTDFDLKTYFSKNESIGQRLRKSDVI